MATRSQRHLRYGRGYDVRGVTAYNLGERSRLSEAEQYKAAYAAGFRPVIPVSGAIPVNTVAPALTGTQTVGQLLTSTNGTWTGTAPVVISRQWMRGTGVEIPGATGNSYTITADDQGFTLRCRVKGSNIYADVYAFSNATGVIP
jgi:hypothetical protein